MDKYRTQINSLINAVIPGVDITIESPSNPAHGDLCVPCFQLAAKLKKNPNLIAADINKALQPSPLFEKTEVAGAYINFFFNKLTLTEDVLTRIRTGKERYGASGSGIGKAALVEHTSINPNASPHIGRARNAIIGDTIVRLLKFEGYNVQTHYFVNDIGKQIAMLMIGVGDREDVEFHELLDLYIGVNNRLKEDPDLEKQAFTMLYKLENGDADIAQKFRKIVNTCIAGQTKILNEIGITHDVFTYESDFIWNKSVNALLAELGKTGKLFEDAEQRMVLNLENCGLPMESPFLVLTRADKTSLYPLRDLQYTIYKLKTCPAKNVIVLGEDQKLYFLQVKAALKLLGYDAPHPVHYSFVLLKEGKMSTRQGNVVLLEDFIKEAVSASRTEIEKRHKTADDAAAKRIAYAAIRYTILKVANEKNVLFNLETALSFEGDTGPYLLYSYARICSLFANYGAFSWDGSGCSLERLTENAEYMIVKELYAFSHIIARTLDEYNPALLANYIFNLTKLFSSYYQDIRILNIGDEELTRARLALVSAVQQVLKNALTLLGIEVIEKM